MIGNLKINEQTLVYYLKNSEVQAFDKLFHNYAPKLYHFSFSLLKNKEDAKDVVQETFCRIWDYRLQIDPSKSFKSYLFSISYHLIIDKLRERLKDQCYRRSLEETFGIINNLQNHHMDFIAIEKEIRQLVDTLPTKRKKIYMMSRDEGLSHRTIAERLGISSKTVENQINLSLKHIKSRLSRELM